MAAVSVACALAVTVASCGGGGPSASRSATGEAARRGEALANEYGCWTCHTTNGEASSGPTWKDLAGSRVQLDNGQVVTADAAYLAASITDPQSQVVSGFRVGMPAFGYLSDDEVADLVAYLQELSPGTSGPAADPSEPAGS